jgi:hypothetical protein
MLAVIDKKKSAGPNKVSGQILQLGAEATIPYLAHPLDISVNNSTIPSDWKKTIVVPVFKGGDRSQVANYKPVSSTSVVSNQMEHVIASYLREIWDKKDWIFEGQHGFSCESQVITVCQDIADSLDNGVRTDAIIRRFFKCFRFSSP